MCLFKAIGRGCLFFNSQTNNYSMGQPRAFKLSTYLVCHTRTKHTEIEHHFIREKMLDGSVSVMKVHRKDNVTNIFTESLSKVYLSFFELSLDSF